ncbi:MAG: hypothetical protein H6842_03850 [Rhodospirillaceae bacterium]|nr:hypothetical protein [Rhodospirillaceae bacterium]
MRNSRPRQAPAIAAMAVAAGLGLCPAGGVLAQDPPLESASCAVILATIPVLGETVRARAEESLRAQLTRFELAAGVTGLDVFACLCRQDPARQFRAVVDTMATASREELGACLEDVAAAVRPEVLTVRPSADPIGDLPVLLSPGVPQPEAGRWDAYSDGDLRALLGVDAVDLATSLDTDREAVRAELERRLLARWRAAGPDALLSDTDLQFALEARIRGAGHAMADVLGAEILRRTAARTAIVRGSGGRAGRGAHGPVVEMPDAAEAARFAGWSGAALLGLADLEPDQVEILTGRPRRAVIEELVRRVLRHRQTPAGGSVPGPSGQADIAVVHGAPAEDMPAGPARPSVRTDILPQAPVDDAGAVARFADCLERMPTDELALAIADNGRSLDGACTTIPQ